MLESISLESYSYHNNEEIRKWKQVTNIFARNKNISSQTGDQSVKIVSKIQIKMRFLSSRRKILTKISLGRRSKARAHHTFPFRMDDDRPFEGVIDEFPTERLAPSSPIEVN